MFQQQQRLEIRILVFSTSRILRRILKSDVGVFWVKFHSLLVARWVGLVNVLSIKYKAGDP